MVSKSMPSATSYAFLPDTAFSTRRSASIAWGTRRKLRLLVDPSKNLFYCYGCGRGGDVIRFAEI